MRALIAFDKFKDALSAQAACEITARALPGIDTECCPLTDGGEGFAEILTHAAGEKLRHREVTGPRGARVSAAYGLVRLDKIPAAARAQLGLGHLPSDARIAVLEMAQASGLALLAPEQRNPWETSTVGTGELMRAVVAEGAQALLLGVGGSATHDLGLGALSELGFYFYDANDQEVNPPIPARWENIVRIAGSLPAGFPPVYIACDVTNPLLGPQGAATIYGPQKGLEPADHGQLEHQSQRLARLLCAHCNQPTTLMSERGAGAAGGIAFGLMTAAGAKLLPGFDFVSAWFDLEKKIEAADLVITGEGRFDASSLAGKGPGAVAARGLALGKTVHMFAGQVSASERPGLSLHAITPAGVPLPQALREAPENLAAVVKRIFAS